MCGVCACVGKGCVSVACPVKNSLNASSPENAPPHSPSPAQAMEAGSAVAGGSLGNPARPLILPHFPSSLRGTVIQCKFPERWEVGREK